MFANGEGPVFIESVKWLEDEDSRLQMAAVLAIGNFARNGQLPYMNYNAIGIQRKVDSLVFCNQIRIF